MVIRNESSYKYNMNLREQNYLNIKHYLVLSIENTLMGLIGVIVKFIAE